mmetsp:Transcript_3894/g.8739  ORF Transcript_3894/g.8739 Transcript_3894/m.8739 type:complete len:104 (+) Transcript_3894:318-629(+)
MGLDPFQSRLVTAFPLNEDEPADEVFAADDNPAPEGLLLLLLLEVFPSRRLVVLLDVTTDEDDETLMRLDLRSKESGEDTNDFTVSRVVDAALDSTPAEDDVG